MFPPHNHTVYPDIAVPTIVHVTVPTTQRPSADRRTREVGIQRALVATHLNGMAAMLHELVHLDLAANFLL